MRKVDRKSLLKSEIDLKQPSAEGGWPRSPFTGHGKERRGDHNEPQMCRYCTRTLTFGEECSPYKQHMEKCGLLCEMLELGKKLYPLSYCGLLSHPTSQPLLHIASLFSQDGIDWLMAAENILQEGFTALRLALLLQAVVQQVRPFNEENHGWLIDLFNVQTYIKYPTGHISSWQGVIHK